MFLKLKRFSGADESTLGLIFVGGRFFCYSLEDQWNVPKIPGESRIPTGRYQIILRPDGSMHKRYTDRFEFHKGMLWLQDVPEFTFIYIHTGNNDDHSEGCILTGDGQVQNITERGQVTSSVAAYTRLYKVITDALLHEDVWITIEDEEMVA
jgi:hypothetical protein